MKGVRYSLLSVIAMAACAHLPRVPAEQRNLETRAASAVHVEANCGTWAQRSGSGVIISERHVLTAVSIVGCALLPRVYVTFRNGQTERRLRMVVTHEDRANGIARLEIASAERFGLRIRPPLVSDADPGNSVCANLARRATASDEERAVCGTVASTSEVVKRMATRTVDDGAPVYRDGELVGIVVNRGTSPQFAYTWIAPIDERWIVDLVPASVPSVVSARSVGSGARAAN